MVKTITKELEVNNNNNLGLRHLALTVVELEACTNFYTKSIGMRIDWQPDPDNVYLALHNDSLALHRAPKGFKPDKNQRLDHLGFFLKTATDIDLWHKKFLQEKIKILQAPRTHRDGCRSFYCADPDGNTVQFIYYP